MPLCRSRLSANLFCSWVTGPILAVHWLRQGHRFFLFTIKSPLAYYSFWVILSVDP
jgi:hypothetical protein